MLTKNRLIVSLVILGLAGAFDSGSSTPDEIVGTQPEPTTTSDPGPDGSEPTSDSGDSGPDESPTTDGDPQPTSSSPTEAEPDPSPVLARHVLVIDPDPNFQDGRDNARFFDLFWPDTDFSQHTVPYEEIFSGGPAPDGIPAVDNPKFINPLMAHVGLREEEPVIAFELNGDVRAYPLQIMILHKIVNDVVGNVPVVVTFCPLCNSALAFERTVDGDVLDLGTSGNLRNSDLVMYDRQTKSWWQQFTGEGIVGTMAGRQLEFLPASIISWQDYKDAFPEGTALSLDTGFPHYRESYGLNPYAGYDRAANPPFLFDGIVDGWLLSKERIAAVTIGDIDAAFPFTVLEQERVVSYMVGDQDVVVFFQYGTQSALDSDLFRFSKDVGATGVFDLVLDGRELTFSHIDGRFADDQTGSTWNIVGHATEGELVGKVLTPIIHANHFWFSWAAFKPHTKIYLGSS